MTPDSPFENARSRPVPTVLDTLRSRIDHDEFDAAVFALEAVVVDLGYADVRPLPGSIAWIDRLRGEGKKTALIHDGENPAGALDIAGISDRFDVVSCGPRTSATVSAALEQLDVPPDRSLMVDVTPAGIAAGRGAGCLLAIAIARGPATPQELRQVGAAAVLADLQELLGPT